MSDEGVVEPLVWVPRGVIGGRGDVLEYPLDMAVLSDSGRDPVLGLCECVSLRLYNVGGGP